MIAKNVEPILLTVTDGSRYIALSPSSVRRLYTLGLIETIRIGGRVLLVKESLDRFIEARRKSNGQR